MQAAARVWANRRVLANLDLLGLALYVLALPWVTSPRVTLLGQSTPLADLVFLGLLPVAAVRGLRTRRRLTSFHLGLAGWVLASCLSTLLSRRFGLSLGVLPGVLYLACVALVSWLVLDTPRRLQLMLGVFWLSAMVAAAGGLCRLTRPVHGWLLDPASFCSMAVIGFCLAAVLRGRRRAGGMALAALAGLLSFWPGVGAMGLCLAGLGTRRWLKMLGGAVAAVVLAATLLSPVALAHGRLAPSACAGAWRQGVGRWLAHPWLGQGLGIRAATTGEAGQDPRNLWIDIAAKSGLLGLLAFGFLIGGLLRPGPSEPTVRALAWAVGGVLLYEGMTASVQDARHLWVLLGCLAAARQLRREDGETAAALSSRLWDGLCRLVLVAGTAVVAVYLAGLAVGTGPRGRVGSFLQCSLYAPPALIWLAALLAAGAAAARRARGATVAGLGLVFLVMGLGVAPELPGGARQAGPGHDLTLVTYNVESWSSDPAVIGRFLARQRADIIFLQELWSEGYFQVLRRQLPGYHCLRLKRKNNDLVLLSRVALQAVDAPDLSRGYALAARTRIHGRTVSLLDVHLDKGRRIRFPGDVFIPNPLTTLWGQQAAASAILDHCRKAGTPVIVCGDFNCPPLAPPVRRLRRALQDGFCHSGALLGYSYPSWAPVWRIDYVLTSPDIGCRKLRVLDCEASDHRPVRAVLRVGW